MGGSRESDGFDEIMVFLSFLNVNVFAAEKCGRVNHAVSICEFFFVDAHTISLHHLTGLTLGWEYRGLHSQQFKHRNTGFDLLFRYLEHRHSLEDIEKCLFID